MLEATERMNSFGLNGFGDIPSGFGRCVGCEVLDCETGVALGFVTWSSSSIAIGREKRESKNGGDFETLVARATHIACDGKV